MQPEQPAQRVTCSLRIRRAVGGWQSQNCFAMCMATTCAISTLTVAVTFGIINYMKQSPGGSELPVLSNHSN
jgi:hypothetical protein